MKVTYKWKTLLIMSFNLLFLHNINLSFHAGATGGLDGALWDGETAFLKCVWFKCSTVLKVECYSVLQERADVIFFPDRGAKEERGAWQR